MAFRAWCLFMSVLCGVYAEEFHFLGHKFDRTSLGDDIDKASMRLLKEEYQKASDKNVVSSPLGVFTLLSLYASGAEGEIRDEIVRTLRAANYSELFSSYSQLNERFSKMDADFLTLANKVYVSDEYTLNDDFANVAVRSFGSEVESISFKHPEQAVATINRWAEQKTKNHLKDPVPSDAVDSDVVSALFNIIFFQGHWNVPFEVSQTKDEDFHVDQHTTVKKPTMHLLRPLFYHESKELRAKLIELPYKEDNFRMVVVLPDETDGLSSVIDNLSRTGVLADVFSLKPAGVEIDLHIPKFSIESEFDLKTLLPKIGVSKMFENGASGIIKNNAVKVSKAFQKAFIKVDEEGATAGAFTGAVLVLYSSKYVPPAPLEIRVDHPFMFLILHEDKILFTGTYSH